jgi:hypothetical protein
MKEIFKMNFYRETIKNVPPTISIPKEFRNRDVEIIILPLDEKAENGDAVETDANGYPIGFFEETTGSLPDFPEREPQPIQPDREEI